MNGCNIFTLRQFLRMQVSISLKNPSDMPYICPIIFLQRVFSATPSLLPWVCILLIDKCLYEYKFDSIVCYKLFEEGYDQSIHRSNIQMENRAREWYEKGYTDIKSLEKHLEVSARYKKLVKLTGSLMRKRLNGLDLDRVKSWAEDLDATEELVTLAFKENEFRSNLTLKNVGDTLAKWYDQGIKTAEEAAKFSEEEHKENKRKATRRKANAGSSWRTGEEAGIGAGRTDGSEKKISEDTPSDDDNDIPVR